MKRSPTVTLTVGFLTLMSLAGCPKEEAPEYTAVCEDDGGFRVPDDDCRDDGSGNGTVVMPGRHWSHYPGNVSAPAIGQQGTGRVTPRSGASIGRAPASGGFGTHGGAVSG
jgi:hypothetical protein